jgi:hypothetical protein
VSDDAKQIRGFLEKYRIAKNSNSKEIRLTINEAEQLSAALAVLLSRENELLSKIAGLQETVLSSEIGRDGGQF